MIVRHVCCGLLGFLAVVLSIDAHAQSSTSCLTPQQNESLRRANEQILRMFEVDMDSTEMRVAQLRNARNQLDRQLSKVQECQRQGVIGSMLEGGCSSEIDVYNTLVAKYNNLDSSLGSSQVSASRLMQLRRTEYPA